MNGYNIRGLRFKLWTYFVLFAAGILIVLWLLQIMFLRAYYEVMKTSEFSKLGNRIIESYGESNFEDLIYQISYKNGIVVQLLDKHGAPIINSSMFGGFRPPRTNREELELFMEKINSSASGQVSYVVDDERVRSHIVVFGAELSDENREPIYLYMNSPLAPVDATTQVLQNQLIIVSIISLLFAFGLSYFIAKKISRPIIKLTESANELAKGNYSIVFEEGGYTEVNQLAHALNYATKELSKSDELRRDLIANVSHDLRTPLTIVKSYAEMIRDISGDNPEKRKTHAKVIIDEADRLSALVSDILDLSKIESGANELTFTEFDLSETVKGIVERFNCLSEAQGYVFKVSCTEDTFVRADKQRIEQVVYNLIINAVNYTGEDKTVSVSVEKHDGKVRFSVTDTGQGISEDELSQIWERYYRSSRQRKRTQIGTGIGLSIVKGILEEHKAKYGVDNKKEGSGSTFWFELDNIKMDNQNQ